MPSAHSLRAILVYLAYLLVGEKHGLHHHLLCTQHTGVGHGRNVFRLCVLTDDCVNLCAYCAHGVRRIGSVQLFLHVSQIVVRDVLPQWCATDNLLEFINDLHASRVFPDESSIELVTPTIAVISRKVTFSDCAGVGFLLLGSEQVHPASCAK